MKGFTEVHMPLPLTAEEAFRCASFGIEHEPKTAPVVYDQYGPMHYHINQWTWGRVLQRNIDDVVEQTLGDELLAWIRDNPKTFAPENPHYVKTHVNAPGTVRSWFRKMRAADFERDVERTVSGTFFIGIDSKPWTLFDTQKVIDRETAAHYLTPDTIEGIFGGIWPTPTGLTYLGINRSCYSLFALQLTEPEMRRGITREDLERFVAEDDAHRSERR